MNRKEADEVKKLFTSTGCTVTCICGCYVDAERNKETELKEAFLSLQEEEVFKYFTIFRNALSRTIEKNPINMEFPLHTEAEGGTQHFLLELRDSQLKDDAIPGEFYDRIITTYNYDENYYIILIHCAYDIPVKATNGTKMFGASDYIYEFVQCTICPVKLSKAELYYSNLTNTIENHDKDWLVEAPIQGFLFPAFNDRNADIHSLLYYAKNPEELSGTLIDELLGCVIPISTKSQKGTFQAIMEEALGENCDLETVKSIHENLDKLAEETKGEPVPLTLGKCQVKKLLETNGAIPEKLEEFEQRYAQMENGPGISFVAVNVISTRSFEIETPDVSTKVSPDRTYPVENRMIEGRPCIAITINEHMEIDGTMARPVTAPKGDEDENVPF